MITSINGQLASPNKQNNNQQFINDYIKSMQAQQENQDMLDQEEWMKGKGLDQTESLGEYLNKIKSNGKPVNVVKSDGLKRLMAGDGQDTSASGAGIQGIMSMFG